MNEFFGEPVEEKKGGEPRKRKGRPRRIFEPLEDMGFDDLEQLKELLEQGETFGLKGKQLEALVLWAKNRTYEDIARELGLKGSASASSLVRFARTKVKEYQKTVMSAGLIEASDIISPQREFWRKEIWKVIKDPRLTDLEKEYLRLRFVEGLTQEGIARRKGVHKAAVSEVIRRAKKKLSQLGKADELIELFRFMEGGE